jgi:hypothetical protein
MFHQTGYASTTKLKRHYTDEHKILFTEKGTKGRKSVQKMAEQNEFLQKLALAVHQHKVEQARGA